MVARELTVRIPESLFDVLDDVAKTDMKTQEEVVADVLNEYLALRKLRDIQKDLAPRFAAAGNVTEDDVEALVDESNP